MIPTLDKGTATPYLALFNSQGKPLKDPKTGLYISEYVTSFQHKMTENSDETSSITIQLQYGDATLLDNPDLYTKKNIYFQYGYVFANGSFICSPAYCMKISRADYFLSGDSCRFTLYASDNTQELRYKGAFIPNPNEETLLSLMDTGFSDGVEEFPIIIKKYQHDDEQKSL